MDGLLIPTIVTAIITKINMIEIWKDIPGFEGIYKCSNMGRVMSYRRTINSKHGRRYINGQIIKPGITPRGYNVISLSQFGKHKWYALSRIIYQTFNGPTNLQIDHINEIKTDNRLENLQPLSSSDNLIKAKRHNKTSKYPGVSLYPSGKWLAQIQVKGKKIGLGYYANEEDAYNAYLKARTV